MWVTVGNTLVQTDNVVTIDTYCNSYDYGLIINGIECKIDNSKHKNLRQIDNILNVKVSEITECTNNVSS